MPSASRSILINRPVSEVFTFFADAENDTHWRTGVKEIKREGELGVGARYRQRVSGPGGRAIAADTEVTAYEPDRHVAFRVTAGPVRPNGEYTFEPSNNGTKITFTLGVELSGLKKFFMAKAVQNTMNAEVAGLDRAKTVLESRN